MRGVAPVTPDPKMHIDAINSGHVGGLTSWLESDSQTKDFRDLKNLDLASPMFMPGIIKESPRPPPHQMTHNASNLQQGHTNPGSYNITVNYNDYSNRTPQTLAKKCLKDQNEKSGDKKP